MGIKEIIKKRRAYRSLKDIDITEELVHDLAECAQLAPSCFNNQPWRFVFVYDKEVLQSLQEALSSGNRWAYEASMIIAVYSQENLDCVIKEREYYLFDTGMATAFLILRATELGLVAHPIAGYSQKEVKEALSISKEMKVITLIIVGSHSEEVNPVLSKKQIESEKHRPERLPMEKFVFLDSYKEV